ncbi:hypothetical protein ACKAV7_013229 [Fusarium commune]
MFNRTAIHSFLNFALRRHSSAAVAAFAHYGQVSAGPCKPITRVTSSGLETSSTATTEASSTVTNSLSVETSSVITSAESSATTFSSEASTTTGDISVLFTSTTETATLNATTTEFASTSTEVSDASTTATATSSAAPVCEFTGDYTNYVQNPSFDDLDGNGQPTIEPWIMLGASTLTTSLPRTGARPMAYSFLIAGGNAAILQELVDTVAGHEYVFKYHWVLIEGQPLQLEECRIGTFASSGGANSQFFSVDGDEQIVQGQYYEQEYRITTENDNQRLSIGFFCSSQPSAGTVKIQIDDVSVYDYYEGCESP